MHSTMPGKLQFPRKCQPFFNLNLGSTLPMHSDVQCISQWKAAFRKHAAGQARHCRGGCGAGAVETERTWTPFPLSAQDNVALSPPARTTAAGTPDTYVVVSLYCHPELRRSRPAQGETEAQKAEELAKGPVSGKQTGFSQVSHSLKNQPLTTFRSLINTGSSDCRYGAPISARIPVYLMSVCYEASHHTPQWATARLSVSQSPCRAFPLSHW